MAFGGVIKLVGGKEYRQEIQNIKKNVEQLGDALTGSAKDFDKMDSAAGKSSRATDKIGDNAKKAAQNVKKLSAEHDDFSYLPRLVPLYRSHFSKYT